jgi:AcrR family transcriptional regulator
VTQIAHRLGVSAPTLYRYIPGLGRFDPFAALMAAICAYRPFIGSFFNGN